MSKPGKVLKGLCKRLKVRLTVKRGKKRVYKSVAVLKAQCKRKKKKKKKVKRRRKFGTNPPFTFGDYKPLSPEELDRERRRQLEKEARKLEQEAAKGLLNLNKPKGHHSPWKYQPREGDVEITFNSNLGITIDWDNKHNIYVSGYENNVKPEIKNKIKKGMFITNINDKKAPVQRVDGRGSFIRMLKREKSKGPVKITFSHFPYKIEDDFDFSIPDTDFVFQTILRPSREQRLEQQRKDWSSRVCSYCLMPHGRCICKQFGRKRKKVKKKVKRKRKKVKKRKRKKVIRKKK